MMRVVQNISWEALLLVVTAIQKNPLSREISRLPLVGIANAITLSLTYKLHVPLSISVT
jgi:hypothetical protein